MVGTESSRITELIQLPPWKEFEHPRVQFEHPHYLKNNYMLKTHIKTDIITLVHKLKALTIFKGE